MSTEQTVFVIDDDAEALASVCALVHSMGATARPFASAEEFIGFYSDDMPGCLVTDVRMTGMSGVELQHLLRKRGIRLPVILLTAYAGTQLTVRAMQDGAVTLLDKPYDHDALWEAIVEGLKRDAELRVLSTRQREMARNFARLSPAEREVLDYVVQGLPNKVIASRLDVSIRTVENRRREVFTKMQAESVADLVRMVVEFNSRSEMNDSDPR